MKYSQICDLTKQPPEGQPDWDGPYCGAFFTTDDQKDTPLVGTAFKGTNPVNPKEVLVDYNYQLCAAGRDYLDQQRVSVGVCTGLFQNFDQWQSPTL